MKEPVISSFGRTGTGEEVFRYTLENDKGMKVSLINYACSVQSILVPDRMGRPVDVVLGYDTVEEYEKGGVFLGAFVGRYANRIRSAAFELNGKTYQLPKNDGNNHLHGTFAHRVFPARIQDDDAVVFDGISEDGEEGFPGRLTFRVCYRLTEQNELIISYFAAADRDTVINFTNHSYFNLNGQDGSTVLDHTLQLNSACFTEGDAETIPTGRILPVEGTPMDFRTPKKLGLEIHSDYEQTRLCGGYDHNFVLDPGRKGEEFAVLRSEKTGIELHGFTDQPGVQLYSGNFLLNERGKGGVVYPRHGAVCLETQHFPCSPNFPHFPSTLLRPGEEFRSETVYQFISD